jgi:hypothetical protein
MGSVSTRCVFTDFRVTAPVISLLTTHCYFVCPVITGSLNPKMKKDVANRISYNSFQIGPQKVDHCLLIISYRRKPPSNGRPAQHRSRCCCGVYQMQVFPSNKFPARPGNVAALSVRLATKIKVAPLGESSRSLLIESRGEDASWSVLDACGVASYLRSINSRRVDNRLSARTGGVQDGRQDKALLQKLTLAILSVDRSSFERTLEKLVPMSTSERELMASSFLSHCVQIKAGTGSGIRPHLQKDRPGTVQIGLTS